eukprot:CAMPEP_0178540446 /NCGR_PEP_ID=MMETSP0697-20121206/1030_1 /TAXON_ID=265572 /ORGANISM="Extubocellulus spinifer, Strain CCMP396" /LENGTH=491 /DNA_ID=CAMNT_0020172781 /DNA_START=1148 /DNA_END=2624 /DNA_ORIENTATION=-
MMLLLIRKGKGTERLGTARRRSRTQEKQLGPTTDVTTTSSRSGALGEVPVLSFNDDTGDDEAEVFPSADESDNDGSCLREVVDQPAAAAAAAAAAAVSGSVVISDGGVGRGSVDKGDVEVLHKSTQSSPVAAAACSGDNDYNESPSRKKKSSVKDPTGTEPPPANNKPLWLIAKEQGIEYQEPEEDPGKVFFVMNRKTAKEGEVQANRKTEYYMANGRDIPGVPQPDSAEMEKPESQLQMEQNIRRAQEEAAAAALRQQQMEEYSYLQRQQIDLTGQYIYQNGDWDDQSDVSSITMGMHEMGMGPSLAHTPAADGGAPAPPAANMMLQAQYSQSLEWAQLTDEQKAKVSAEMAQRSGGAVGFKNSEDVIDTMVDMFTPDVCCKQEPTKRIVRKTLRQLGALQPLHSTKSIRSYGVYRPAAAAASATQLSATAEEPTSPRSANSGPSANPGSANNTVESTGGSQTKVRVEAAKPVSPLKSLRSIRGLYGGVN